MVSLILGWKKEEKTHRSHQLEKLKLKCLWYGNNEDIVNKEIPDINDIDPTFLKWKDLKGWTGLGYLITNLMKSKTWRLP